MKEIIAIDYALLDSNDIVVMFDLSKELLLEQFANKGKKLDTGIYYIYKCLQYGYSNELKKTDDYLVVL